MSLRARVVIAIALLFLSGAAIGVALAGWRADKVLHEELVTALAGGRVTAEATFDGLAQSRAPRAQIARLVAAFDGARHVRSRYVDESGRTVLLSTPLPVSPAPDWFARLFPSDVQTLRLAVPAPPGGAFVLEPVAANDVAAVWSEFIDLVAVLGLAWAIGAAGLWFSVGRALAPLRHFSAAFERIGRGDYKAEVALAGPPELIGVGRSVNQMAERLRAMQSRTHRLEAQLAALQEEERADLARDLHDEIGPHLFAASVDVAMARRMIAEARQGEALRQMDALQASVAHMQSLVRDILARLRPPDLIDLGLEAAIGELAAFWRARHPEIAIAVEVAHEEGLAEATRATLYRVVQEGLANAVRHGQPSRIDISIDRISEHEVFACVADNGVASAEPDGTGYGLIGMRERVLAAGGALTIDRQGGWTVKARLPVAPDPLEAAA
ncbi:MAG TPA: sensor histidine kinase [Caulobacteraceae bacterium]